MISVNSKYNHDKAKIPRLQSIFFFASIEYSLILFKWARTAKEMLFISIIIPITAKIIGTAYNIPQLYHG